MLKEIKLVNSNIANDEIIRVDDFENQKELLIHLNCLIDGVENILNDKESIYNGYDLQMLKEEVSKEELDKLLFDEDYHIVIAENPKDKDYCVYLRGF